jgi:branched-chain amino acid transport system substrate-binding protein
MGDKGGMVRSTSWRRPRSLAVGLALATALTTAAAGSAGTASAATGGKRTAAERLASIPASAMSDHTGITATSVDVGNVSTETGGLFTGATVGTRAYADFVNSTGGVDGRKIDVTVTDDQFSGAGNKQATQSDIDNDFALVGSFSLEDSFGGALLAKDPGMPDVSETLDLATSKLPNVLNPQAQVGGFDLGPLEYLKAKYPDDITKVGTLLADEPSAAPGWDGEKYALGKEGYKIVYDPTYSVTQTDFTANVVAMKDAGVKMLFIDQMPQNYASSLLKDLVQQDFHPVVVLGAAAYSNALIPSSGGAGPVDGAYLEQDQALYLGQDAAAVPAVSTFLHWVNVADPGFKPDLFTLYGWLSAELFAQGLREAGKDPSRGSLLKALDSITSFNGDNLIAPNDPAARTLSDCYLLGRVAGGQFQRLDDPPVSGSTHGFRCTGAYVVPPGT